jgi:hypothetical protein
MPDHTAVRDSKNTTVPALDFPVAEWRVFIDSLN